MRYLIIALFLTFITFNGNSQQKDSLIKVTDQLYMITGLGGNVSFLTTDKGVLVVDAGTVKSHADRISKHIRSVTDKPVKYLVLTHYHFDHTFGACGFNENITVIGHKNIYDNLKKKRFGQAFLIRSQQNLKEKVQVLKNKIDSLKGKNSDQLADIEKNYTSTLEQLHDINKTYIVFPDITFEQEMNIYLGSDTIKLIYPGSTHTDCSILVSFLNQKTLVTGDFFVNHSLPFIDYQANSNTKNWIEQIKNLNSSDFKYIIPGHGKLGSYNDLMEQAAYLNDLRDAVKAYMDKGTSLDSIKKELKLAKYANYGLSGLSFAIESVYKELTEQKN